MGKPMGRPPIEIDKNVFEGLCRIQCTEEEISCVLAVSEDTVNRWCKKTYGETFAVVSKKYMSVGKSSLRRIQFKLAEKSATMAIWLGKQYLNQTDKIIQQVEDETTELAITVRNFRGGDDETNHSS